MTNWKKKPIGKEVGKTEIKLPRSGFVHPYSISRIDKPIISAEITGSTMRILNRKRSNFFGKGGSSIDAI